jgi:hypothetical protein
MESSMVAMSVVYSAYQLVAWKVCWTVEKMEEM